MKGTRARHSGGATSGQAKSWPQHIFAKPGIRISQEIDQLQQLQTMTAPRAEDGIELDWLLFCIKGMDFEVSGLWATLMPWAVADGGREYLVLPFCITLYLLSSSNYFYRAMADSWGCGSIAASLCARFFLRLCC